MFPNFGRGSSWSNFNIAPHNSLKLPQYTDSYERRSFPYTPHSVDPLTPPDSDPTARTQLSHPSQPSPPLPTPLHPTSTPQHQSQQPPPSSPVPPPKPASAPPAPPPPPSPPPAPPSKNPPRRRNARSETQTTPKTTGSRGRRRPSRLRGWRRKGSLGSRLGIRVRV